MVHGGNAWVMLRLFASPVLGQEVLAPPATNDPWFSFVGTCTVLGCSVLFSMILAEAGGGRSQPEFFSTHPNPANRVREIEAAIASTFPEGVPEGLVP